MLGNAITAGRDSVRLAGPIRKQPTKQDGSILVVVLMFVGLIAALAAAASEMHRSTYAAGLAHADSLRAEMAMRSAIERTVAHGGSRTSQLRGGVVRLEQATVVLDIVDEASRIDLNVAPPEMLAGLFGAVGVSAAEAETHAAQIVAWRKRLHRDSPEEAPERIVLDGQLFPTNPFLHTAQIAHVPGISRGAANAVMPFLTVASNRQTLNPMLARLPALMAIPGMTQERARAFMTERLIGTTAFEKLLRETKNGANYLSATGGAAARFTGRVRLGERTERTFDVVVAVVAGDEVPYRVLAWEAIAAASTITSR